MRRLVLCAFCLTCSFLSLSAWGYSKNRFSESPLSEPEHCTLLESTSERIRFGFHWSEDAPEQSAEEIYLAIPRKATPATQYDRWYLEIGEKDGDREIVAGSADTASEEEMARVRDLLDRATAYKGQTRYFLHDVPILRFALTPCYRLSGEEYENSEHWLFVRSVDVTLEFSGGNADPLPPLDPERLPGGFPFVYRDLLFNHEHVDLYRTRPEGTPNRLYAEWAKVIGTEETEGAQRVQRTNAIKILTRQDALYALRAEDIRSAGIDPATIDLSTLTLWSEGRVEPYALFNADSGHFDENTAVVFRAEKTDSAYTRDTVFWLMWGKDDVSRRPARKGEMGQTEAAAVVRHGTESLSFEEDRQLGYKSVNYYEWFWKVLGQHNDIEIVTPGRSKESSVRAEICVFNRERVRQTVELRSGDSLEEDYLSPDQEKIVSLVISATDAVSSATMDLGFPRATPLEEPLDPLLTEVTEIRRPFLNAYRFEYTRDLSMKQGSFDFVVSAEESPVCFEVSDCTEEVEPVLLAEQPDGWFVDWSGTMERDGDTARFIVTDATENVIFNLFDVEQLPSPEKTVSDRATDLHESTNSADVLVVAHEMFLDPILDPWLELRKQQGYRVELLDVQDIYDEYNYGQPSCQAIKDFLEDTLLLWEPPLPQYLVLIGDASRDHKDNYGTGVRDLVPCYTPEHDPEAYASDVWYTYLFGGENDTLPEMILGRISVRSVEELGHVIEKIVDYEKNSEIGPWRGRNVFVNDDTFREDAIDTLQTSVPPSFENRFVNQSEFPHVTLSYLYHMRNMEEKYAPKCTWEIIDAFNQGALLLQYYGHGGNQMWSHERILVGTDRNVSEVLLFDEHGRLPVVVNWSCLTGYVNFNIPPFHVCLAEELLRQPGKGGIAVWAPSENGSTEQHKILAHHLVRVLGDERPLILGDVIENSRLDFSLVTDYSGVLRQYILFGDPLVRLSLPTYTAQLECEPTVVRRGRKATLSIRGTVDSSFTGTATLRVFSDEQDEIGSVDELSIAGETFECQVEVRTPSEAEHLRIQLYGVSEDGESDIWGGTKISAELPNLVVRDLEVSADESGQITAEWVVANESPLPASETECKVHAGFLMESVAAPELPGEATATLQWEGTIEYSTSVSVTVDAADEIRELDEDDNHDTAEVFVDDGLPFAALAGDATLRPDRLSEGMDARIRIPFAMADVSPVTATVNAWLFGLPEDATYQEFIVNHHRQLDQSWTWNNVPAGEHELSIVASSSDVAAATVGAVRFSVTSKPDLAFTQGDLRYEPEHPILGQSIEFVTRLYNVGNAPAYNVRVLGYDGRREQNKIIRRFQNRSYAQSRPIPVIEPGDSEDIRIRWDLPGFRGLGDHEITLVADPSDQIPEIDETNNEDTVHLTIHDLPDLTLDPWDDFQYMIPPGVARWGQRIPVRARVRNEGDSPAEQVRMSFLFNGKESTCFFPLVRPGRVLETQTALPIYHGKSTLEVQLDRYDLIAEKGEEGNGIGNNLSKPRHLYMTLHMPPAPEKNDRLLYHIEDETEFAGGIYEYAGWMPEGGLGIPSDLEEYNVNLQPIYVENPSSYSRVNTPQRWWWQKKYSCFVSPSIDGGEIQFDLPAPKGKYEVSIEIFSKAWTNDATGEFFYRADTDEEFKRIVHSYSGEGYYFQPLGMYHIQDDHFRLTLRSSAGPEPTSIYKVKFKRPDTPEPVAAGYPSALFPAGDFERKRAVVSWDAEIPEGTSLGIRARWWERGERNTLRAMPWPQLVDGTEGELEILGKGDYLQFYALFARFGHGYASPVIESVTISIESADR